ncbi:MAG: sigma-E factor negative regulatory protein [Gammaproteobacteria bacterium]
MNEKISALMDAELDALDERRTLDALARDAELRHTWDRYHLARAAIARQLDYVAPAQLAEKVYARLQDPALTIARSRFAGYRLAGGLAVAASVAALAVVALPWFQRSDTPSAPTLAVSTFTPTEAVLASASEAPAQESEGRLSAYLVGHNEFMPTAGMGGMLPYVRVVTYDRDK